MDTNFPACIAFTLAAEGGFSDNPADPGGATNKGITLTTYRDFLHGASVADLKAIPSFAVTFIYWVSYWRVMNCGALPAGVDLMVFDFGVNAGPDRSVKMLQHAVGTTQDGVLGPISMAAIKAKPPISILQALSGMQTAYYRALPEFPTFGNGWLLRTGNRGQVAAKMVGQKA